MGDLGIATNLGLLAVVVVGALISWKISGFIHKLMVWASITAVIAGVVWYLI